MGKSKSRTLTKALGIKQQQPKELRGLAAAGAGAATRYKPGDARLTKNQGGRKQLIGARNVLKTRTRISEILRELQALPIARELSKLLKLPEGTTVAQGIAIALAVEALNGDVQAIKHLQLATEGLSDGPKNMTGVSFTVVGGEPEPKNIELVVDFSGEGGDVVDLEEERPPFADTKENKQ